MKVVAFTYRRPARATGSPDLKIPDPTNTPLAPSCIIIAHPAASRSTGSEQRHRQLTGPSHLGHQLYGAANSLAATNNSSSLNDVNRRISPPILRICVVALDTSRYRPHPWTGSSPPPR